MRDDALQRRSEQIERLLDELASTSSPTDFARVEELVRSLAELYGAGLERMMAHLESAGAADAVSSDELLSALLVLHGLHPRSTRQRVEQALEHIRPALQMHAGGVKVEALDEDGTVTIRLLGSCDGCASSRATVEQTIEQAIVAVAPEVARIELSVPPPTVDSTIVHLPTRRAEPDAHPRCELCSERLSDRHRHVVEVEARTLSCACTACSLLFEQPGAARGRYRTVPDRVLVDPSLDLTEEAWASTGIPVTLAFVFYASNLGRWTAVFPSPAGPAESEIDDVAWEAVRRRSPLLSQVEPDVEAVLVRRPRGERSLQCLLVPIDVCYRLSGEIRTLWSGMSGGDEAHRAIDRLFDELSARSRTITQGRPHP